MNEWPTVFLRASHCRVRKLSTDVIRTYSVVTTDSDSTCHLSDRNSRVLGKAAFLYPSLCKRSLFRNVDSCRPLLKKLTFITWQRRSTRHLFAVIATKFERYTYVSMHANEQCCEITLFISFWRYSTASCAQLTAFVVQSNDNVDVHLFSAVAQW